MSTPFRLLLPRHLHDAMVAHAQAELPNECCGMLAGRVVEGVGQVEVCYPFVNELDSPREFQAEPRSMFLAFKDLRKQGFVELAIYHSHPGSPPVPSRKDRERNYSPEVMNMIVGLQRDEPEVRAWWLTDEGFHEGEWQIVDEGL